MTEINDDEAPVSPERAIEELARALAPLIGQVTAGRHAITPAQIAEASAAIRTAKPFLPNPERRSPGFTQADADQLNAQVAEWIARLIQKRANAA